MQVLNVHLISDFTCDTLMSISSVIASQFNGIKINRYFWPFIRHIDQVDEIVYSLKIHNGIVMFSVLADEIEEKITQQITEIPNCRVIPVMDYIMSEFASYLKLEVPRKTRRGAVSGDDYIFRMNAMRYTMNHDDGRLTDDLEDADIVLIGVSRTSKSPTSIYLAHRGYKVANIPFVSEDLMPRNLFNLKNPLVIGLMMDPERLASLRESRMIVDGSVSLNMQYNKIEYVIQELRDFRRYCGKLNCRVLDVTRKSVEEVSAAVIQVYQQVKKNI